MTGLFKRLKAELFDHGFLDTLAKNTGVIKRLRKISGSDLLDTLLFDSNQSFNGMSMQLMLRHSLNISKQALHQKYNEGLTEFIKGALERLLAIELPCREIQGLEINIKDSTRFALPEAMADVYPGTKGCGIKAGAALQFEFGIKSGSCDIRLTPGNCNDQKESHLDQQMIRPGVLYMRDLGYSHIAYMSNIIEKKAFFVNKLSPKTSIHILRNEVYQELDLTALQKSGKAFDGLVYIGKDELPVRMIIEPVSDEIKNNRISHTDKYNKKKGHQTTALFKLRAGFNFIVTNLDSTYSAELIRKLYHLRWQIELVFKGWKSSLKIHQMPKGNTHRITCALYSKLLWAMLSWKITMSIGKIGEVSILKVHSFIASGMQELRLQLWGLSSKWLDMLEQLPFYKLLKEQKKGRLKTEEIVIII
ncbi:IS4 family transposase [Mucilaginibacter sp. SJ]|uniref:IS4 family transposase n=1 Tax=Mucilaginibacter sp. SJ TaxID=3029053 RepID=UPI0023A9B3B3|nr:IS4 family transposase [Mucilaginibacter sp. SJ]WEA03982.1 IS4 family transposase [Mucilaginibacter sp. SJ]WEA03998.1 IS4 family transposase [Mucilaginibacter sp. SJ]